MAKYLKNEKKNHIFINNNRTNTWHYIASLNTNIQEK
jgi:hypothetical protein